MQLQSGPSEPPNHQIKLEESTKSFKARKERLDKLKERLKIPICKLTTSPESDQVSFN